MTSAHWRLPQESRAHHCVEALDMDEWPSTPGIQDLRNVAADLHHRLQQRRLMGDADAIAHALSRAQDAGVPDEERERMATSEFQRLFDDTARRRSKRGRLYRRSAKAPELPEEDRPAADQRQLGPGGD